jgi:hypothetical protein
MYEMGINCRSVPGAIHRPRLGFLGAWLLAGLFTVLSVVASACALNVDGDTFAMSVMNDTPDRLFVSSCREYECRHIAGPKALNPTESTSHVAVASETIIDVYIIQDTDGRVIGCLMLGPFSTADPGKKVNISEMTPCPPGYPVPEVQ